MTISENCVVSRRLTSLDALRGADLFWILGGHAIVSALATSTGWGPLVWVEQQCHHVKWHGFHFYDLIFPLFLFLAGVSMPLSFAKRIEQGATRRALTLHAMKRGLILVLLGLVYNGFFAFDFENLRCASVLARIGLAWMLAAFLVIWFPPRIQVVWFVGILLGYWAALALVPVPDTGVASFEPGQTLTNWIDRQLLPGVTNQKNLDAEGLLSTFPAICTALAGVFAGRWLTQKGTSENLRVVGLIAAGGVALALAAAWDQVFPINKKLWTSSFVLCCAGWSLLFLAIFYWVIDVRGWKGWSTPFVVFGANSITIYMLSSFVDFSEISELLIGENIPWRLHPVFLPLGALVLKWFLLDWMYRRRIFLRI